MKKTAEEIYPTEYQPPTPSTGPTYRSPTAFDTRNTGVTLEVAATSTSDRTIELQLSPEVVTPLRLETWMEHVDQWGDGSIRMPIYETLRTDSSISVESGKFQLVSALTPHANAPVPADSRKILVFPDPLARWTGRPPCLFTTPSPSHADRPAPTDPRASAIRRGVRWWRGVCWLP